MQFVTHTFMLGDTIHGIIRKYNCHNMTIEQVQDMMALFNEKNGQVVPKVGEIFEIPQWESHEIPQLPTITKMTKPKSAQQTVMPSSVKVLDSDEQEIVVVQSKEESKMLQRQMRRENARREQQGLPPKPPVSVHVKGEEPKPSKPRKEKVKTPTPKEPSPKDLTPKDLTPKEQKVLNRALLKSVKIIDEGNLVEEVTNDKVPAPVEKSVEVKDTVPAKPSPADAIAEKRKKARQRRQQQLQQKNQGGK